MGLVGTGVVGGWGLSSLKIKDIKLNLIDGCFSVCGPVAWSGTCVCVCQCECVCVCVCV